ncbi:MAG: pilus assembly protein [Pirellulales bacterium]|nr:pilus assembly protein [Pirellulales bacterium]
MSDSRATERRHPPTHRRGAATVEFALVALIIFTVIVASIEFGRALMAIGGMKEAVREGCRLAVLDDTTTSEVEATVSQRMNLVGIGTYSFSVTPDPASSACQWDSVTVSVSTPFSNVSLLPVPAFVGNITLATSCTLPREGNPCGDGGGVVLN